MKILVLTYFDQVHGPIIYFKAPESFDSNKLDFIPYLMDLEEKSFFCHEHEEFDTINLAFDVPKKDTRGGVEMFMISLILYNESINPKVFKEVLKDFIEEFISIKDLFKGIDVKDTNDGGAVKKAEEMRELFYSFYNDLPEETLLLDRNTQIMVFGLTNAGKTTLINKLRDLIYSKVKFNNLNKGYLEERLFFENLSMTTFDLPLKRKFGKLWRYYMKKLDGIAFVVDASDSSKFNENKIQFHILTNNIKNKSIPLLIVFNKCDLETAEIEKIMKNLDLQNLDFQTYKCFETNALTGQGILDSFTWIEKKILKRIFTER